MNNLLKTIFIATSLHFVHTAIFYKDNCIIKMQQKKQTTGKQKMTTKISIPILRTIDALLDTVYALFGLIIIDYITGVCLAVSEQKISSKIGTKGIAAKVLIVCLVALSYIVDTRILDSREKFSSAAEKIQGVHGRAEKQKICINNYSYRSFACSCNCNLIFHSTHEVSVLHVSCIDSHFALSCAAFLQFRQKKADTHKQAQ